MHLFAGIACAALTLAPLATAQSSDVARTRGLFGATWLGSLVQLDIESGQPTTIGQLATGGLTVNALAASPDRSTLYASFFGAGRSELVTIDPATAAITSRVTLATPADVRGLTFTSDGKLFATVNTRPNRIAPDDLVTIDPVNGNVTTIGRLTGDDGGEVSLQSLTTDPLTGDLFAWGSRFPQGQQPGLFTLDERDASFSQSFADNELLQSLEFLPDGKLIGARSGRFFKVDRRNQDLTLIGAFGSNVDVRGLAFIPSPGVVPAFALAGVATMRRRR
jgi:hypothetical protein